METSYEGNREYKFLEELLWPGGIKLFTGGDCFLSWNLYCRLVVVIYFIC